jgi:hypothetical protein
MLVLSAIENLYITGLDVCNAYLYGKLDEEIYVKQPNGFKVKAQKHKVYRLQQAFYGLKQAGLVWWQTLAKSMVEEFGFTPINSDAGVYIYKEGKDYVIAIVYIDDTLFIGPNKSLVNKMKDKFMKQWECRDLGEPNKFLGMRITNKGQSISIDQCTYLNKLLECYGMTDAKSATTPLPASYIPVPHTGSTNPELQRRFQVVIGSLLYIMLGTRPDITYAVTKLAQYSANPTVTQPLNSPYLFAFRPPVQELEATPTDSAPVAIQPFHFVLFRQCLCAFLFHLFVIGCAFCIPNTCPVCALLLCSI